MWAAPAERATSSAKLPMGVAPVVSTVRAVTGPASLIRDRKRWDLFLWQGVTMKGSTFIEWELAAARQAQIPVFPFVLAERAPWPPHSVDGFDDPTKRDRIREFRQSILTDNLTSQFEKPDQLEQLVGASLAESQTTLQLGTFLVQPASFSDEERFSKYASDMEGIFKQLRDITSRLETTSRQRTNRINLASTWWDTRLFLLAFAAERLTSARMILITEPSSGRSDARQRFVGLIPNEAVIDVVGEFHSELSDFARRVGPRPRRTKLEAEIDTLKRHWTQCFPDHHETEVATDVTAADLTRWFGHAILRRPLVVRNAERPTPLELAQVMSYPHDFVPIEWTKEPTADADDQSPEQRFDVVEQADLARRIAQRYTDDLLGRAATDVRS